MRTCSQSRDSNRQQQVNPTFVEPFNLVEPIENQPIPVVTMDDTRTMAQLLEAPTVGYEDAIDVPEITRVLNFELKHWFAYPRSRTNNSIFDMTKSTSCSQPFISTRSLSTRSSRNVPSTSVSLCFLPIFSRGDSPELAEEITADNFELKHGLLTLLMLFPFSLEGAARIWLEKEPPRSILTWDDLVSKFINKFFPPSKTTNLRNEITRFQQRFDETFYEAWDRFNDLLRACPHHGFSELHQLDTFYNALNSNDQDSLNSAAGGNFLDKMPRDCLRIIESKSKVRNSRNKPVVAKPCVTCGGAHSYRNCPATVGNVYRDNIQEYVSQAAVANFNQGNTSYRPPIANLIRPPGFPPVQQNQGNNQNRYNQNWGNNYNQGQIYQPPAYQASALQTQGVSKTDFQNSVTANDAVMRNMQNQMTNLTDMLSKFVKSNTASSSGSGTLPSNTITNPKEDLKGITTRSGVAYQGPTIPTTSSSPPKVVERETEVTKDTVPPTNNGSAKDVQPPVVPVETQNSEPVVAPVSAPKPNQKPSIPYPSRLNDQKLREKADNQIEKFYEIFKDLSFEISFTDALLLMPKFASTLKALIGNKEKLNPDVSLIDVYEGELTLRVGKEAITFNLDQTSRYSSNYDDNLVNRIDVIDMACEELFSEVLLDFLLKESPRPFLTLEDDPTSQEVDHSYYDPEGDILLLEAFLNDDPSLPPPTQGNYLPKIRKELKVCEAKNDKSSIDEPPEVELKDLPPHLEYAFLEGDDKLPIIIAKDLSVEEKAALIKVLKSTCSHCLETFDFM
ncbi:reverse transcriptase domain-containing protein [Tanacetum coccineum]